MDRYSSPLGVISKSPLQPQVQPFIKPFLISWLILAKINFLGAKKIALFSGIEFRTEYQLQRLPFAFSKNCNIGSSGISLHWTMFVMMFGIKG